MLHNSKHTNAQDKLFIRKIWLCPNGNGWHRNLKKIQRLLGKVNTVKVIKCRQKKIFTNLQLQKQLKEETIPQTAEYAGSHSEEKSSSSSTESVRRSNFKRRSLFACNHNHEHLHSQQDIEMSATWSLLHPKPVTFVSEWKLTIGFEMNIFLLFTDAVTSNSFWCPYTSRCHGNLQLEGY